MTSATITSPVRPVDAQSPGATFPAIPFSRLLRVEWGKATDTRAAYGFVWNTARLSKKSHRLSARAIDKAGNLSGAASITVVVH